MKNILCVLVLLINLGLASCNADRNNNGQSDSLITDTAIMDTSSMDSVRTVDSVIRNNTQVDSAAVGSTPPGL